MTSAFKNMARAGMAAAVALLLSVASLPAAPAVAFAANEPYTYSVTLLAGQQGDLTGTGYQVANAAGYDVSNNGKRLVISGLPYGSQVSFFNDAATVDDSSKYYVKGVRLSGRDNSLATNTEPSFMVTGDRDYVVAYGMKGNLVNYTVRYVDTEGNELAPSNTYYGNVGDVPVVAYLYMDGYRPQAYNLTGTLKPDAADNVFTFEYTRLAQPVPGAQTVVTPPAPVAGGAAGGAGAAAPLPVETLIADDGTPLAPPAEIMNIDDEENPLASGVGDGSHPAFTENGTSPVLWPTVVSGIIVFAGLVIFFIWLFRRRSEKSQGAA